MALGTPGLAVPDVEAVLKLRPLHLPSLVARAEIREANGQYRQARGDCLKGLRVCRSLPATVAGVVEGEASLEATLEQVGIACVWVLIFFVLYNMLHNKKEADEVK